jgi:hypothetical protein
LNITIGNVAAIKQELQTVNISRSFAHSGSPERCHFGSVTDHHSRP